MSIGQIECGRFIVFDGGEGAGKGTVLRRLKEELPPDTVFTREPGGTPFAERIRKELLSDEGGDRDPRTQFDLFWAARADHLQYLICPALLEGRHVICDRFDSSTFAYQLCGLEQTNLRSLFWSMRSQHLMYVPTPYYFYLDVDPEEGLRRVHSRGEENHFDKKELDFHTRVREGYREFLLASSFVHAPLARQNDPPVLGRIIDANRPIELVVLEAIELVQRLIA